MIVGKLMVVLGLDSKGFNTGIDTATGKTSRFAKATNKTFKLLGKAAKAGMLRDVTEIQRITNKINSNTVKIQNLTVQKTKLTTQLTELQK